jgi:tripartite ATP-independent transporter DctM subunit
MFIMLAIFLAFVVLSVPIAFSMIASSMIYLIFVQPMDLMLVAQKIQEGLNKFSLLAVPFFLILGQLMQSTGVTERFIKLASALVGHIRGGLAHVNIVTSMLMAGIQGSSVADTAALGSILIPTMVRNGYSKAFSAVVTAASSTVGPIIPPSILMVIYGAMGNVSIGRVFLGGAIPGGIMGLYLIITTYIIARRRGYGVVKRGINFREIYHAVIGAFWPLMVPAIIVGGILGGIFTATESGAVALLYLIITASLKIGGMRFNIKSYIHAMNETINIMGSVLFIVAGAWLFGWILNAIKVGDTLISFLMSISSNPIVILLMINVLFLILGCFIETIALLILLTPIFVPVMHTLGINPVHFGVMIILNLVIGLITPPVGISMLVGSSIAQIDIEEFAKESWPFLIALFLVLLILIFFPQITMYLPDLLLPER